MTHDTFMNWLRNQAERTTQRDLADVLGVSATTLNRVLLGKDTPPPKLLKALGYERRVTYHRVKP